jgi:RNA polymerase sigma factor (sigma-70 family)
MDGLNQAITVQLSAAQDLWEDLEQREMAINELVESHLRLAKPFAMRIMSQPFELDDLLNEAFFILRRAAERFDATTQNRFSSYAAMALQRELKRRTPSRIGVKRQTAAQLKRFGDAQYTLAQQRGESPSLDDVYDLLACSDRTRIQIENARRILAAQRRSQQRGELILQDPVDAILQDPAVEAGDREEIAMLHAALEKLSPFEKSVVIGKCILASSFRQMAKEYHKSASTLRDVFAEALTKLARRIDSKWKSHKPR